MAAPTVAGVSPSVVGATSPANLGAWPTNGTITVQWPGGGGAPASGDLILLPVMVRNTTQTIDAVTGYTRLTDDNFSTTSLTSEVHAKIAGSSESAPTVTDSQTATQPTGAIAIVVRGWSGNLGDLVVSTTPGAASSANVTAPDLTTVKNDCLIVRIGFQSDDNQSLASPNANPAVDGYVPWDTPAGHTAVFYEVTAAGSDAGMAVATEVQTTAGSVGTAVWATNGSDPWHGYTIAIPPAAGGTLALSGSVTATGALTKQTAKTTAGSASATGAVLRLLSKTLGGSATPAGAVAKRANKPLAGSSTPAGALATLKTYVLALAGSLAASGALVRKTVKQVAGSATASGLVGRVTAKSVAGTVTATGAVLKLLSRLLGGSTAPAGAVAAGQPGAVRNLQITLGPPQTRWRLGPPGTAWSTGKPRTDWDLGPPEV